MKNLFQHITSITLFLNCVFFSFAQKEHPLHYQLTVKDSLSTEKFLLSTYEDSMYADPEVLKNFRLQRQQPSSSSFYAFTLKINGSDTTKWYICEEYGTKIIRYIYDDHGTLLYTIHFEIDEKKNSNINLASLNSRYNISFYMPYHITTASGKCYYLFDNSNLPIEFFKLTPTETEAFSDKGLRILTDESMNVLSEQFLLGNSTEVRELGLGVPLKLP